MGAGGDQGGGTYMYLRYKDSNAAVGIRDGATGKALEGADKQTLIFNSLPGDLRTTTISREQ